MYRATSMTIIAVIVTACAACTAQTGANHGSADTGASAASTTAIGAQDAHKPFSTAITAAGFRAYDKAISSDQMAGRKPGTPGGRRATAWIAQQFEQLGLQPGNDGSWFQAVPTISTTLQNPHEIELYAYKGGDTQSFAFGKDMVAVTLQAQPHVAIKNSDIVFVGYGIDAPQWRWNDYEDLDVKGKTVIVLVNDPGYATQNPNLFKGNTETYYGRWTYKYEEAARQGAAACLVVHATGAAGYPWSVVKNSWSSPQLALPSGTNSARRLPVAGWITTQAAQRLFREAGMDFNRLKAKAASRGFKPVPLHATASITLNSKIKHGSANNVLGLIKGASHSDEVVVYSAHWDHLGTNDELKGDEIFNGAIDNGTGISALLEIAGAFMKQQEPPQRSVLFLATTLEESGLLGSRYYTEHPVFPMDKTVANINMDSMDVIGPTRNLQIIGDGQSHLEDILTAVLKEQGRYSIPDQNPQTGLYYRSDQFSFAKAGVPAIRTRSGNDLVHGGVAAGRAALAGFRANRYHTPHDNFNPNWNFSGVARDAQALYEVGRRLAATQKWPTWYDDSAFRAKRVEAMSSPPQQER